MRDQISERIEHPQLRGDTQLMPVISSQNFYIMFGAAPANGILAKSEMMRDLKRAITRGYDRQTKIVQFPRVLEGLVGADCNFESSASSLLRTIELPFVGNTVVKSFALIIVNTELRSQYPEGKTLIYPDAK